MASQRSLRTVTDTLLALGLTVAYQVELWRAIWVPIDAADEALRGDARWIAAILGSALTLSLLVRRHYPLLGLSLAFPALAAAGQGGIDGTPALTVTLIVVLYSVGSETHDVAAQAGAAGVGGLIAVAILHDPDARLDLGDLLQPVLLLGGAWLAGLAVRLVRDRGLATERRSMDLERDNEARAAVAVADERARIGRELHDVVAHAIAVIVVQARGGRASLAGDPDATREALDAIEKTGIQAITEMHRLVGVIRDVDDPATLKPTPGLSDVGRLIDDVRDAGLAVEFSIEGEPIAIAPGVDLSAYRIIQEALTNAIRHAGPATARVRICYGERDVDLEVIDSGGTDQDIPGGVPVGLVGMRERAALVGGHVETDRLPGGGFRVTARLPIDPEPA